MKNERVHDPTHVTITVVQEFLVLSQALICILRERKGSSRRTCKKAFFFFSPAGGRQWGTWALVGCREPDITPTAKGIDRLQSRQYGCRGGVDWNV